MAGIFISYRREDTAGWAGRLSADLAAGFRDAKIFMDIDAIPPGVNFDEYIAEAVGSCDVLIALVGPHWLTVVDKKGRRRLDSPDDFIRIEIATALKRNIRVIPALVGGATVPAMEDLPEDLKALARRQAYQLADHRWTDDCKKLIAALKSIVPTKNRSVRKAAIGLGLALLLALGTYSGKSWYDRYLERKARQAEEIRRGEVARAAEQTRSQEDARKAEEMRIAEEQRQAAARKTEELRIAEEQGQAAARRAEEQDQQQVARNKAAAAKRRLLEARKTADDAYQAAVTWQTQVDQYAQMANRHARAADSAAAAASNVRVPSRSQAAESAVATARGKAAVAREAALEADTAAKAVQAAVATARMKAQAATNTTDPSIAAEAGEDALAAERAVKTATSNAMKEAEVARAAAVAAVEAKNQVVGIAEKMARSAPSDVKKVPDTGTIDPRKKGIVSPPPLTGTRTSRNEIRNFRAENISDVELKVVVDYTYIGDKGMGGRLIAIQACAEQANGQLTPGTACWNRPVTAGDGSATIHIKLSNATGTFVSSVVRVCMLGPSADPSKSRGERFYCESFPYAKVWRR